MPIDHFGFLAKFYARADDFSESLVVARLLDLSREDLLLDVGGGTGRVAGALRTMVGETVIADPSIQMLRYADEKNFATVCAPAEGLPFPNESFDKIIMVDAFHHVMDQGISARELWRVLHPGGKILIIEPDLHEFVVRLLAIAEKALLMRSHLLTFEAIQKLFEGMDARVKVHRSNKTAMILMEKVR